MSSIMKRITKVALLVAVLSVAFSAAAQARSFGHGGFGVRVGPRAAFGVGIGRPFFDPFWGPYYPYGYYAGGYPYLGLSLTARVRVEGVPKQTQVFVDGYFAGNAGTFATTPGGHAITLYLPGYRTVTQNIYVRPDSTFKINGMMDKLPAGEVSTPPPPMVPPVEK
jgi:PEGA domain